MPCNEGPDPADFAPGAIDPGDDPATPDPEMFILDATIVSVGSGVVARFPVVLSNSRPVGTITARYDTANGTATAVGGYYTPVTNGTITITPGQTEFTIEITILNNASLLGVRDFFVNLTNPVNCTIVDAQGKAEYNWGTAPPPPPPGDPTDDPSFTAFPKPGVVYDQFAGCDYTYACTAAAAGGAMSALYNRTHQGGNKAFDWQKLYRDAGGCLSCSHTCDGENWLTMLRRMRDVGIKEQNANIFHKISGFNEFSGATKNELLTKAKRILVDQGVIYFVTPWYSSPNKGWNRCLSCNSFVIRNPDRFGVGGAHDSNCDWTDANLTLSPLGQHVFIITGWNDTKAGGAFEIQSSHGRDWGNDGRCWMPYSVIGISGKWRYYKLVYGGTA